MPAASPNSKWRKWICAVLYFPILRILDAIVPKNPRHWAFTVHHIKSDQFIENARAVFEEVKDDPNIIKYVFVRDADAELGLEEKSHVRILPMQSLAGASALLRCKVIFVTHSIAMDYAWRWEGGLFAVLKLNLHRHCVVNLWHGIPLKKLYALWNSAVKERLDRVSYRKHERRNYAGLVASSQVDSMAMTAMFSPITYQQIFLTGLPRNDFLMKPESALPQHLREQLSLIRGWIGDKKLVVYAPTYRQTAAVSNSSYYQFSKEEMDALKLVLKKHNAVLGFRMHYFRNNDQLFNMESYVDNEFIFDLGHNHVSEIAPVIRSASIVISDYSSVFLEAIYIDKPVIGFMYDMQHYHSEQDGVLYDFDMVFPGPVTQTFADLLNAIDQTLRDDSVTTPKYEFSKKFFFDYCDAGNARRVVEKVNGLIDLPAPVTTRQNDE